MNIQRSMEANYRIAILLMLIFTLAGCGGKGRVEDDQQTEKGVVELSPEEFKSKLSSTPDAVLIDVRKPEEVEEGIIEGAVSIDYTDSSFSEKIAELDKLKPYFIYCKSGKRSGDAAAEMKKVGFENIIVLKGGYKDWLEDDAKLNQ